MPNKAWELSASGHEPVVDPGYVPPPHRFSPSSFLGEKEMGPESGP